MHQEKFKKEVGERFFQIRTFLKLNQTQMGELLGCSQGKIKDIETGRTNVVTETAVMLSNKYNISLDWLYIGKGTMHLKEELTAEEKETLKIILSKLV